MKKGFTLIELIVVLGILVVVSVVLFTNLATRKSEADLVATDQQVATLLRRAENDATEQEGDVPWGVYFSNSTTTSPFYALFTTSYSTSSVVSMYLLPATVSYQTSTLPLGASTSIIFSPISGSASVSTTIGFYMPKQSTGASSTIYIASSGQITY